MDYLLISLAAAAKAMDDVVLPALQATEAAQAVEQAVLVRDVLSFAAARTDDVALRRRFELRHAMALARAVQVEAAREAAIDVEALEASLSRGTSVLADASVTQAEVVGAAQDILHQVNRLLAAVGKRPEPLRQRIERVVLSGMRTRIDADRAWLRPLGFDLDPNFALGVEESLLGP